MVCKSKSLILPLDAVLVNNDNADPSDGRPSIWDSCRLTSGFLGSLRCKVIRSCCLVIEAIWGTQTATLLLMGSLTFYIGDPRTKSSNRCWNPDADQKDSFQKH